MNMCKNIKIRILAFLMAFWLAFSVSYNDYQEVKALEWAIPTVAFDTALKFLLGLLGVSLTSKALHDNVDWSQVQQDCMDYQIQKGNDAVAVGEWWENVAKGTLNQASACWTAFKEWVVANLKSDSTVDYPSFSTGVPYSGVIDYLNNNFDLELTVDSRYINYNVYGFYIIKDSVRPKYIYLLTDQHYVDNNNSFFVISGNSIYGNFGVHLEYNWNTNNSNYNLSLTSIQSIATRLDTIGNTAFLFATANLLTDNVLSYFTSIPIDDSLEGIFDSANDKIEDTAITTDTPSTTAIPDTLPLPWDNVSNTADGVSDAIDALQEQVAEGVLSLEDYWERVQELIDAMAIDTTTDEVLPTTQDPTTGENETIQDKVQENVSNTAFTLGGMEKVFPFCIPWDIYAFVTLLVAEPVAPVINYPFYNPVTNQNINISIDFSDWETVVVLFRYILDFLLIIGLLLLARSLAGAGGDD